MLKKKQAKNIQIPLITSPTDFPSGIAVKTENSTYWIKDGKRFRLISDRAEKSWDFITVMALESSLVNIKKAGVLGFRDGTLIKNIADGKMYLVSQNKRRHITTPDVFDKYGLDRFKIIEVSSKEAEMHELGESL